MNRLAGARLRVTNFEKGKMAARTIMTGLLQTDAVK
jgi:hypothetical protein